MWIATFRAEEELPHVIKRANHRHTVEQFAEQFLSRIPHPEVTFHWVTFEEVDDGEDLSKL